MSEDARGPVVGERKEIVVTTRRIHFGVTCGEHGTVAYEWGKSPDGNGLYGLPFSALGVEIGDGDRFKVTVERLRRKAKGPRFPKNPWLRRRSRRREGGPRG